MFAWNSLDLIYLTLLCICMYMVCIYIRLYFSILHVTQWNKVWKSIDIVAFSDVTLIPNFIKACKLLQKIQSWSGVNTNGKYTIHTTFLAQ